MSAPTFYHSSLTLDQQEVTLSADESAHASRSRRLGEGADVQILNGKGLKATGKIASLTKSAVTVSISASQLVPAPLAKTTIATAIPKSDRQRIMVEMLVQLGVSSILPLDCERSITRARDNTTARWQRYAIEACKQSENPWLPLIQPGTDLSTLCSRHDPQQVCLLHAHMDGVESNASLATAKPAVVCVGPEGGFTDEELQNLSSSGSVPLSLGPHILRIETAAVAVAALRAQLAQPE